MPILDAEDLAEMRADMIAGFDARGQVLRSRPTRGSDGGVIDDYQPAGGPLPCRVWNKQATTDLQQIVQGDAVKQVNTWRAQFGFDADVRGGDRIAVNGMTLLVAASDAGHSDAISVLAICRQVT